MGRGAIVTTNYGLFICFLGQDNKAQVITTETVVTQVKTAQWKQHF